MTERQRAWHFVRRNLANEITEHFNARAWLLEFGPAFGEECSNGATVVLAARRIANLSYYTLCRWGDEDESTPWVVWRISGIGRRGWHCDSGYYFREFKNAYAKFLELTNGE